MQTNLVPMLPRGNLLLGSTNKL